MGYKTARTKKQRFDIEGAALQEQTESKMITIGTEKKTRKSNKKVKLTATVSASIEEDTKRKLEEIAEGRDIPLSRLIARILREYVGT